jgi:hypothetical protein
MRLFRRINYRLKFQNVPSSDVGQAFESKEASSPWIPGAWVAPSDLEGEHAQGNFRIQIFMASRRPLKNRKKGSCAGDRPRYRVEMGFKAFGVRNSAFWWYTFTLPNLFGLL